MVMGSSNWSQGGFVTNVEANLLIRLDLSHDSHLTVYRRVTECFDSYWSEQ